MRYLYLTMDPESNIEDQGGTRMMASILARKSMFLLKKKNPKEKKAKIRKK